MSSSTNPLDHNVKRSGSRTRRPNSRPTTPLRPSSRSSLRESQRSIGAGISDAPLDSFEPAFAELSDSMADLEANLMHLQIMHESLARFSDNFASFLYGLNMNAFCVDFPEAPVLDSFLRAKQQDSNHGRSTNSEKHGVDFDGETTFMYDGQTKLSTQANPPCRTTDTSFVENPPTSSKPPPKFTTPAPASRNTSAPGHGGGNVVTRGSVGRGGTRGTRASGLARARGRGIRGSQS